MIKKQKRAALKMSNSILNKQTHILYKLLFIIGLAIISFPSKTTDMYFVTVSDSEHYPWLTELVESILKYNYTKINTIAVFNLGLTEKEINKLNQMSFVKVYEIEDINTQMRDKFTVRTNGRVAKGWYSWKPAVFHQALEIFPYFLYLDSGIEVTSPLDDIFEELIQKGYYLFDCPHLIYPVVTDQVKNRLELEKKENQWILEQNCISGGLQGISQSVLDSYVKPIYHLASDIKNFEDNGTAPWGYGFARHDQSIFSIFARKLKLKTHPLYCNPKKIRVGNKKIYFGALKHFKLRKHNEKNKDRLEHAKVHKLLG